MASLEIIVELGRNLESIRKQAGHWAEEDLVPPAAQASVKAMLSSWLPPGRYPSVLELGLGARPGLGSEAREAIASYQGFDRRGFARERARQAGLPGATLASLPEGAELPTQTASQDLFLSLFTFERLRMDELYMAIAEMRRVVKPGGYAALASLHPGNSWWERITAKIYARTGRGTPLQLAHYLSPEDWDTVREGYLSLGQGRVAGLALLRRRANENGP